MRPLHPTTIPSLLLVVGSCIASCASLGPPPTPPLERSRQRLNIAKEFQVGMLSFGYSNLADARTDKSVDMRLSVPSLLLTELGGLFEEGKPKRFAVFEGGALGGAGSLSEETADGKVDGYVNGTITSVTDTRACFDVRLSNAHTHEILHASSNCVALTASRPQRDEFRALALEISRTINRIDAARILKVDGEFITIDKGLDAGVMRGMVAYLREVGLAESSPDVHAAILETFIGAPAEAKPADPPPADPKDVPKPKGKPRPIGHEQIAVGELYILSVDQTTSIGFLYRGNYALTGDVVEFK